MVRTPFGHRSPEFALYVRERESCYREVWSDYSEYILPTEEWTTVNGEEWRTVDLVLSNGLMRYRASLTYDADRNGYWSPSRPEVQCPIEDKVATRLLTGDEAVDKRGNPLPEDEQPEGYVFSAHPEPSFSGPARIHQEVDLNRDDRVDLLMEFPFELTEQYFHSVPIPSAVGPPIVEYGVYISCGGNVYQEVLAPDRALHFDNGQEEVLYALRVLDDTTHARGHTWNDLEARVWRRDRGCRLLTLRVDDKRRMQYGAVRVDSTSCDGD